MLQVSTNLWLLPAPLRPEAAEYVSPGHLRLVLQALRRRFDFVVVDTAPVANDAFFAVLESSDDVLCISTQNVAVLKNNRLLLDLLEQVGAELEAPVRHVLTRASSARGGIRVRDVEQVLNGPVFAEIDNDYPFVEGSINEGVPFVWSHRGHRLSKQVFVLAAKLEEETGHRLHRRSPLRRLAPR